MNNTPKSMRLHIGIFGRRNVGKSSLMNALVGQDVSIVSAVPGTTTDVVQKAYEMKPLGPVLFLDTAGIDDAGELGMKRIRKTLDTLERIDICLLVTDFLWGEEEEHLLQLLQIKKLPLLIIFNKSDIGQPNLEFRQNLEKQHSSKTIVISAKNGIGIDSIKTDLIDICPKEIIENSNILSDIIGPGDLVVLVVPIDLEAPKGRLILPQVQTLREILDCDASAVVVKERELSDVFRTINRTPKLVITDSQAILKVSADVPESIPLTTFSILFARWKGDLETFVQGANSIDRLKSGNRILILESCTHHAIGDDIGRVKIPRWLQQYVGGELNFDFFSGHDFPETIDQYQLIIHCGACMTNKRDVLTRIMKAKKAGVPITNYGLIIAKSLGVLKRSLSPFPQFDSF